MATLHTFLLWILLITSIFLNNCYSLPDTKNLRLQRHHRDGVTTVSSETTSTLLENDPCLIQYCMKGRECIVQGGVPRCVCTKSCPAHIRPVCGSDTTVYNNHCEMHAAACRGEKRITQMQGTYCVKLSSSPNGSVEPQNDNATLFKPLWYPKTGQLATASPTPQDNSHPEVTSAAQDQNDTPATMEAQTMGRLDLPLENMNESENEIKDERTYGKNDCAMQEYEVMKDNLLLYNHARLMSQDNQSRDYLLSIMFSHYDKNNDGQLQTNELSQVAIEEHMDSITSLTNGCTLSTMVKYDDTDHDGKLSINEFYVAFSKLYSVSVVSLDKALEINHLTARVGDNVEIKCDVTGSPVPPIVWSRYKLNLATLEEEDVRVFSDGSLYLTHIQLQHAGNYTCHAQRNKDVVQTHVLTVYTVPEVHVTPRIQSKRPGEDSTMLCHVAGEPFPKVEWLKNDEPLKTDTPRKYQIVGNGTSLKIKSINFADTGAYMCQATNIGGLTRDISSLVVQEQPTPSSLNEERRFFAFHDWGVSIYEPSTCRLFHKIHSTDVIPGTQEKVCGDRGTKCDWGRAVNVANRYVYASQPKLDRIVIISKVQMVVVDVVPTDKYPVELYYVPHLDQVWVLNWRSANDSGIKTIQVIRDAGQKRKHHTVHPEPIDGQFDLVTGLFIPSPFQELSHYSFKYGYVTHTNQRGLYKLDLVNLRYTRSVDLTPYNCVPIQVKFSALYGAVFMQCIEPVTNRPTGQLILDYLTDTVIGTNPMLSGIPYVSPDSRKLVTFDKSQSGATLIVQEIKSIGLEFLFDVKTSLNISDLTFYPSQITHSYDLYASGQNKEDILYVNLNTGKVEVITGVGKATLPEFSKWNKPNRPIRASGLFGQYMVTSASEALFAINGRSRTVNCEIGGVFHPSQIVWTTLKLH